MKKLFIVFLFFLCTYSSVVAEEMIRVYELDSFETPVTRTVVESMVQVCDTTSEVEKYVPELAPVTLRKPEQIFLSKSIPFTPVFSKSENAQTDPGRLFPRPRPELRWMITGSPEPLPKQVQTQSDFPFYGGALIIGDIEKMNSQILKSEEKYRMLNLYHGFRQR